MHKSAKKRLHLSHDVIRALRPEALTCAAGGKGDRPDFESVRCTEPSVSICVAGCWTT